MIPGVQGDSQVYLNGDFLRIDEARISVLDRGFIFGDGIYEVVPVYRGKAFRMAEHLNRLDRSLAALRIAQPHDRDGWVQLINELLARNIQDTCIVYLQVTRGVAKRDHQFPAQPVPPTVFGMVSPWAPPSAAQRQRHDGYQHSRRALAALRDQVRVAAGQRAGQAAGRGRSGR